MATTVILPKQGQSVESCIITEWYKKVGDRIEIGDILFAYETDKSSFEEEAQAEGVLLAVYFEEGDEAPVLSEVAVIGEEGEKVEGKPSADKDSSGEDKSSSSEPVVAETADAAIIAASTSLSSGQVGADLVSDGPDKNGKIRISPRARKMAELKGISIQNLLGTGPNGRIIVRDVEAVKTVEAPIQEKSLVSEPATVATSAPAASEASKPRPVIAGEFEDRPLSNLRKLVARAMHASLQNSAQLTHHLSADARKILSLRKKAKALKSEGSITANVTLNDMICFAVIRALKKHPDANVHLMGESVRHFRNIHLGIAVDTERGLMVPVVRNAEELSLEGLSSRISQLAEACRSGSIDPDLLQPDAATFTVSNLGNYGVEMFTPVINLPQAGILGVNTIIERPARLEDGAFGFVPYMGLSLTYDHRVLDGGPATLFLAEIKNEIENFNKELLN